VDDCAAAHTHAPDAACRTASCRAHAYTTTTTTTTTTRSPTQGTGWDVVALSDRHPDYSNSCGTCYEVKCEDGSFKVRVLARGCACGAGAGARAVVPHNCAATSCRPCGARACAAAIDAAPPAPTFHPHDEHQLPLEPHAHATRTPSTPATRPQDGYGSWLDRKGVCKDSSASVVVTVTDTCPCVYSNNFYSNKRWCCGDMVSARVTVASLPVHSGMPPCVTASLAGSPLRVCVCVHVCLSACCHHRHRHRHRHHRRLQNHFDLVSVLAGCDAAVLVVLTAVPVLLQPTPCARLRFADQCCTAPAACCLSATTCCAHAVCVGLPEADRCAREHVCKPCVDVCVCVCVSALCCALPRPCSSGAQQHPGCGVPTSPPCAAACAASTPPHTDMKWGVVGIKYRKVACDHKPAKWASGATFPGGCAPRGGAGQRGRG
jgi:hypothetical protein